jgi:hypothetical protein
LLPDWTISCLEPLPLTKNKYKKISATSSVSFLNSSFSGQIIEGGFELNLEISKNSDTPALFLTMMVENCLQNFRKKDIT